MRILFITPYPSEGASNRYRVEQYLPYLKENDFKCRVSPFVSPEFYRIIYKRGYFFKKAYYFLKGFLKRAQDVISLYKYDVIFIHREACPLGMPLFEWLIYISGKPMIFDFDDAIFLENFNPANSFYRFLKFPSKIKHIIRMSKVVIAANMFLKEYAGKFNKNVYIIPTCVDTEKFNALEKNNNPLIIGWIGSPTTAPYLRIIYGALRRLSRRYAFVFKVVGAGEDMVIPDVRVENREWRMAEESHDFQSMDIGVYPLPDNLWARGKAGFKAIQYMAAGVPAVVSPVGMVNDFIQDGSNGFLAGTEDEWVKKISALIENVSLRHDIGFAGRKTVEEKFSVKVNVYKYLEIIKKAGV